MKRLLLRPRLRWMPLVAFLLLISAVPIPAQESDIELRRTPVVRAFERSGKAVVNISCKQVVEKDPGVEDLFDHFFDWRFRMRPHKRAYEITSVGSGFVVHSDGYVVTNAHVVMKTVDQRVIFADGSEYKAKPVAIDRESDLAVLKIDAGHPLPTIRLGKSDDLMIGETVVAIGNPLGYHHTLTTGVVSAVERTLSFPGGTDYKHLIQTDASINPGNSGGPLLNILGELIGVNTAIRGDAQNIGFAIPVDTLRNTLPRMLSLERLKRVQVGMRVKGHREVRVVEILKDGPAYAAGVRVGDRVLEIDHQPMQEDLDFYFHLLSKNADERVPMQIERGNRKSDAVLKLKAIPIPDGAKLAREKFGLSIESLASDLARTLSLDGGLFVKDADPSGPAYAAGIRAGMIIVTIAGYFPRDLDHVGLLLEDVKKGDVVAFHVWDVERFRGRLLIRPYEVLLTVR